MLYPHKSYDTKVNVNQNPEYVKKVLNLFLAISASDKRALGFV